MKEIKQVVILAGGKGTRMRELTDSLPKPMVKIGSIPVLVHLMNIYKEFGNFEFLICSGYKSEIIEEYFKNKKEVKVYNTGLNTNTGGRLYKIKKYLDDKFYFTYGDGLANVNIEKLYKTHLASSNIATITVTNPTSRFGLVEFDNKFNVKKFVEKPKLEGYVNIGFMVIEKSIFEYLNSNDTLESETLKKLVEQNQLGVNIHKGFFEPMDTYREYLLLNNLWKSGSIPWANFDK